MLKRTHIIFTIFFLSLLVSTVYAELADLKYIDVSESVTLLQNEKTNGANITCFATDAGLVFVDCSFFTDIAAKFRKDMEAKYNKKTLALLLSHGHTDHFFGMGAFRDVPVVAAMAGKEMFEFQIGIDFASRVEAYEQVFPKFGEALETADLFMPTLWFQEEIQFGTGESKVIFRSTGGHSVCSSYAYMPGEGVLAAGDNIQVDFYPYFGDRTGDMPLWIEILKKWESMNIKSVCPGHGRFVETEYITATREYFENLLQVFKQLKTEGLDVREAVVHADLPQGYWPKDAEEPGWWKPSVAYIYQSLK